MDSNTAYMVFDFKQKFLAKSFREDGDSYYGKKEMLWWVYVMSDSKQDARCCSGSIGILLVEIDITRDRARFQILNKENEGDVTVKELTAESSEVEEGSMEWKMHVCGAKEDDDLEWEEGWGRRVF